MRWRKLSLVALPPQGITSHQTLFIYYLSPPCLAPPTGLLPLPSSSIIIFPSPHPTCPRPSFLSLFLSPSLSLSYPPSPYLLSLHLSLLIFPHLSLTSSTPSPPSSLQFLFHFSSPLSLAFSPFLIPPSFPSPLSLPPLPLPLPLCSPPSPLLLAPLPPCLYLPILSPSSPPLPLLSSFTSKIATRRTVSCKITPPEKQLLQHQLYWSLS